MGNTIYSRRNQSLDFDSRVVSTLPITDGFPVSLDEAKNYLRIVNNQDDSLINGMIIQATRMAETYLNRDINAKARELYYPYLDRDIKLYNTPIDTSVTIVVEIDGVATTGFQELGLDDPTIRLDSSPSEEVVIKYTTKGLGGEIKQGVLAAVALLYYGRDSEMNTNYMEYLAPYKKLYI